MISIVLLLCAAAVACGKKGPPLAPLRRVPSAVTDLTASRFADDVFVRFTVPSTNIEGPGAANLARLEVYALTTTDPLSVEDVQTDAVRQLATLLATPDVRTPLPPPEPGRPAPPPLGPGLDQRGPAEIHDTLTGPALEPISLPSLAAPGPAPALDAEAVSGPLVAPDAAAVPRRYYFVVGVTSGGRYGPVSAPVPVPLGRTTSPPTEVTVEYDEKAFALRWLSAPDALLAEASAPADGLLPSKPLRTPTPPTTYDVFAVDRSAAPAATVVEPRPLNEKSLAARELTIEGVTFGRERCFAVRAVDNVGGLVVRGAPSAVECVTPVDAFAPAAPRNLQAVAGAGAISLIWEDNTEPDLAGYLVLRGDVPGDTLTPLTPAPIREPRFDDRTVQPGARYVYVVVAVDTASPRNTSAHSNRAEETAR